LARTIDIVKSVQSAAGHATRGNAEASTADDPASRVLNRLGDMLDNGRTPKKPKRTVDFPILPFCTACKLCLIQLADFKVWKHLEKVDMEDIDDYTVPPLALLNYLQDKKDVNPREVPFVELMALCVPDWST
jgi:hypothetical protein